ncbi:hypothetical protein [Paenibacillus sp. GCM10028914]|uniref:hypothetical protein n=1 Tax=Paenibacillus sp. GCM10028914 TaxID=3273416 RepID=UPI00361D7257
MKERWERTEPPIYFKLAEMLDINRRDFLGNPVIDNESEPDLAFLIIRIRPRLIISKVLFVDLC